MANLNLEIGKLAADAVEFAGTMNRSLDFSESSVETIEEMLAEMAEHLEDIPEAAQRGLTQRLGCYLLEVGLRAYGGRVIWNDEANQPVLVVGEPDCRVAVMTFDKVRGRMQGDTADHIPFFWAGFAERARKQEPGSDVLVV